MVPLWVILKLGSGKPNVDVHVILTDVWSKTGFDEKLALVRSGLSVKEKSCMFFSKWTTTG